MTLLLVGIAVGTLFGALVTYFVVRSRSAAQLGASAASAAAETARADAATTDRRMAEVELDEARGETASARTLLAECQARCAATDSTAQAETRRANGAEAEIEKLRPALAAAQNEAAALRSSLETERAATREKGDLLTIAETRLRETFKALSADALQGNNEAFLALASTRLSEVREGAKADLDARKIAIDEMLKPVRESLVKIDTTIHEFDKGRVQSHGALAQHLTSLEGAQKELQGETRRLVTALRAPQVRGAWGEIQLRRVVEMAGMLDHCDFHVQVATQGGNLRPDLVVRLPGGKNVVVDSKAPLAAYLEAMEATDDTGRAQRQADHARHVRTHMTQLASKSYWAHLDATPEFVVMFLPGEAVFSAALQEDPSLIEFGVERGVIPASPVTLIALLRAVSYGWNQEKIAENAQRISDLGQELCERMATLVENYQRVGKALDTAVGAYNASVGSLESRVLVSARRFKDLGVPAAKEIKELEMTDKSLRTLSTGD